MEVISIESKYKIHAVRILACGKEGSGCLIQPIGVDYSYVLTAKHCLSECISIEEKEKILVYRYEDKKQALNVKAIFTHDDHDIAIIQVEKAEINYQNYIGYPEKAIKVSIYGYPKKLAMESEPREDIQCEITFCHQLDFELSPSSTMFTFNTGAPENIVGFSGSGVYVEERNQLKIIGIFTSLKAEDGVYNKLKAYNLLPYDELLLENNLVPLQVNDTSAIITDGELLNKVFYLPYELESEPYYLKRQVDETVKNYLSTPKHIWVSGFSGVGKTNLIFRSLKVNKKKFIFIDLSTLQQKTIEEYFNYINVEIVEQCNIVNFCERENIFEKISYNLNEIGLENEDIILFVDEVPISDKVKFYKFLDGFLTISEHYVNRKRISSRVKWIISTRINPEEHLIGGEDLLNNKIKAFKNFHFKNLILWNYKDLKSLLVLLQIALNFKLDNITQDAVIAASNGFPGKLKNIIERMIMERCSIQKAITITQSESL